MTPKTIELIIRHAKGIVAAAENDNQNNAAKTPKINTYEGKKLGVLSNDKLQEAYDYVRENEINVTIVDQQSYLKQILSEANHRGYKMK